MYRYLRYVPKNKLSRTVGRLVHARMPKPIARKLVHWFARTYQIDTDAAGKPLHEYPSIGHFFVRELREGLRPIESDFVISSGGVSAELCGAERSPAVNLGCVIVVFGLTNRVAAMGVDVGLRQPRSTTREPTPNSGRRPTSHPESLQPVASGINGNAPNVGCGVAAPTTVWTVPIVAVAVNDVANIDSAKPAKHSGQNQP